MAQPGDAPGAATLAADRGDQRHHLLRTPMPGIAMSDLGLKGFWMGYFAGRAAPFGAVGPGLVEATFRQLLALWFVGRPRRPGVHDARRRHRRLRHHGGGRAMKATRHAGIEGQASHRCCRCPGPHRDRMAVTLRRNQALPLRRPRCRPQVPPHPPQHRRRPRGRLGGGRHLGIEAHQLMVGTGYIADELDLKLPVAGTIYRRPLRAPAPT